MLQADAFGVNIVKLMYFFKNVRFFPWVSHKLSIYRNNVKEGSTKIVIFISPGTGVLVIECDHKSHIVKMHHFFKKLLYSQVQAQIRQNEYTEEMTKELQCRSAHLSLVTPNTLKIKQNIFFLKLLRYHEYAETYLLLSPLL